jgi:hypothetical protein
VSNAVWRLQWLEPMALQLVAVLRPSPHELVLARGGHLPGSLIGVLLLLWRRRCWRLVLLCK